MKGDFIHLCPFLYFPHFFMSMFCAFKSGEKNGNFKRESEGNSESFNTNEFLLIKYLFFLFKKVFFQHNMLLYL